MYNHPDQLAAFLAEIMKTTLTTVGGAVVLSLSSGLARALIAVHFENSLYAHSEMPLLRTKRLEVLGSRENVEAILADEGKGMSLKILSNHEQPILTLSVVEGRPEKQTTASTMDAVGSQYPYAEIDLNNTNQEHAITIANPVVGEGLISFSSSERFGKIMLGHFMTSDYGTHTGAWGLEVNGIIHGIHAQTGVGITDCDHVDKHFLVPAANPVHPFSLTAR
jgi:hypothetical protein